MNLARAHTVATDLIRHYALGVSFCFDSSVRRFGVYQLGRRRIKVSRTLTELNSEETQENLGGLFLNKNSS